MLTALFQVVFAAVCTVSKSAVNVILYQMLLRITSKENDPHSFVIPYAEFHLGKAFFQGYGVPQSEENAER